MKNYQYTLAFVCCAVFAGCQDDIIKEPACGNEICGSNQVCESDRCVYTSCDEPEKLCDDKQCYNIKTDDKHCGSCDNVCGQYESCQSGECKIDSNKCVLPNIICEEQCVNPLTSEAYCGNCETKCVQGQICDGGRCVYECESPKTPCSDGCYDLTNDTKNCNACGHDCNEGVSPDELQYVCVAGECVYECPEKQLVCGGNCTDPKKDKDHCGATDDCKGEHSGYVCLGGEDCVNGRCACIVEGEILCKSGDSFKCSDPYSKMSCGCNEKTEGIICSDLPGVKESTCTDEPACVISECNENRVDCNQDVKDGCEADLTTVDYCGSCTHKCDTSNTSSVSCVDGDCVLECDEGATLCGEKCVLLSEDIDNCGWCGNPCLGNSTCVNGFCVVDETECKDGYADDIILLDENNIETYVKAYCINSKEELEKVRDHLNSTHLPYPDLNENPDNAYILMSDIKFGEEEKWTPIGKELPFEYGYFLGNGKHITGGLLNAGLFESVRSSHLDGFDLRLNVKFSQNDDVFGYTGVLVGNVKGETTIRHIRSNGVIQCYSSPCGGLIGVDEGGMNDYSMIELKGRVETHEKTIDDVTVSYKNYVGGLMGSGSPRRIQYTNVNMDIINTINYPFSQGLLAGLLKDPDANSCAEGDMQQIYDCHVKGKIEFKDGISFGTSWANGSQIGGFAGQISKDKCNLIISNCSAEIENHMKSRIAGGFVAEMQMTYGHFVEIEHSKTSGELEVQNDGGGFVGRVTGSSNSDKDEPVLFTDDESHVVLVSVPENSMDSFDEVGGFVGYCSRSKFERCRSYGRVMNNIGNMHGGFVGKSYRSTFNECISESDVCGESYVGGFGGADQVSTFSRCVSKGEVKAENANAHTLGGFQGDTYNSSVSNSISFGNVIGNSKVGSFIGSMSGGTVEKSIAMGNVSSIEDVHQDLFKMGFVGAASVTNQRVLIDHVANYGDIHGKESSGGLIGYMSSGEYVISNVLIAGNVSNGPKIGYLIGEVDSNGATNIDNANMYYWNSGDDSMNPIGSPSINTSYKEDKIKPFTFNDDKEAVLEDGSKLIDQLSSDIWQSLSCNLKTGAGLANPGNYIIPVLKNIGLDICE